MIYSILLGFLGVLINFILFIGSIEIARRRPYKKFDNMIWLGFTIRMIFSVIFLFLSLKFLSVSIIYFVISFLFFTFVLMIFEIIIILKKKNLLRSAND